MNDSTIRNAIKALDTHTNQAYRLHARLIEKGSYPDEVYTLQQLLEVGNSASTLLNQKLIKEGHAGEYHVPHKIPETLNQLKARIAEMNNYTIKHKGSATNLDKLFKIIATGFNNILDLLEKIYLH